MTEQLIRGAVLLGLEDAPEGSTREQIAEVILDSIRTALRLEARMGGSAGSLAPSKPIPIQPEERQAKEAMISIPTPPANTSDSMIVLPGDPPQGQRPKLVKPGEPFAPAPEKKKPESAPIRISSLSKPLVRVKDNWTIENLLAALHAQMPEALDVIPNGKATSIRLVRNIEAAPPSGAAKVIYTIAGMSPDQPGVQGKMDQSTGEVDATVVATKIGRFVSKTFFVTDPLNLMVEDALAQLQSQARDVFQVRERELFSNTPRRTGPLRFDNKDPHVDFVMDLNQAE